MRALTPPIAQALFSGEALIGKARSHGRVTVQPDYFLRAYSINTGNMPPQRRPIRWFQNVLNNQVELEVPNVRQIDWEKSIDSDAGTCTITIANQSMKPDGTPGLGNPGWFTWARGASFESQARWGHTPNLWRNVLVPNALIRTWQGYGGHHLTLPAAITAGHLMLTGVWLVDEVAPNSRGELTIKCRDMYKLLVEQQCMPPLIPETFYPQTWCRYVWKDVVETTTSTQTTSTAGKKRSVYGNGAGQPFPTPGEPPGGGTTMNSSSCMWYGHDASIHGHKPTHAFDGNDTTFWLSVGNSHPDKAFCCDWIELTSDEEIDQLFLHCWGGNYHLWVSVWEGDGWVDGAGGDRVPYDPQELFDTGNPPYGPLDTKASIYYVTKTTVPWEQSITIKLPRRYHAKKVRLSFRNHTKSPWGPYYYRVGVRRMWLEASGSSQQEVSESTTVKKQFDGNYKDLCVDTETEILTKRGWLRWNEVKVGDETWSANPDTGRAEWKPIEYIYTSEGHRTMVHLHGQSFDALATKDHRWLTWDKQREIWKWKTTESLGATDWIPRNLPPADHVFPTEAVHSDEFVELAAWFWTEGWWDGKAKAIGVSQSLTVHPEYCDRITRCFEKLYGPPGVRQSGPHRIPYETVQHCLDLHAAGLTYYEVEKETGVHRHNVKRWAREGRSEYQLWAIADNENNVRSWKLDYIASEPYREIFDDDKVVDPQFLLELTKDQLDLFIDVSFWADGSERQYRGVSRTLTQSVEDRTKMFEFVCTLAGHAICGGFNPRRDNRHPGKYWTRIQSEGYRYAQINPKRSFGSFTVDEVDYDGVVWCPIVTDNRNWLARRNGKIYFTGNSDIAKQHLLWAGFWLYNPNQPSNERPQVFGSIESTGIAPDECLPKEMFDKKPVMSVIHELRETVGYITFCDWDGSAVLRSPNWWRSGNILPNGQYTNAMFELDERTLLTDFSVRYSDKPVRSPITISTDEPTAAGDTTVTTIYRPQVAWALKGMVKPASWVSGHLTDPNEQRIVAELAALHMWFAMRQGDITCVGNPAISIDDQVRVVERMTSDSYIYYVRGIQSRHNLETGQWEYGISGNWLGDEMEWAITADNIPEADRADFYTISPELREAIRRGDSTSTSGSRVLDPSGGEYTYKAVQ